MLQGRIQDFGKGGSILGLQAKKGESRRGSNFGPNFKKPTSWVKKVGGPDPWPPWIRPCSLICLILIQNECFGPLHFCIYLGETITTNQYIDNQFKFENKFRRNRQERIVLLHSTKWGDSMLYYHAR